jgi:hypothetical protein
VRSFGGGGVQKVFGFRVEPSWHPESPEKPRGVGVVGVDTGSGRGGVGGSGLIGGRGLV